MAQRVMDAGRIQIPSDSAHTHFTTRAYFTIYYLIPCSLQAYEVYYFPISPRRRVRLRVVK